MEINTSTMSDAVLGAAAVMATMDMDMDPEVFADRVKIGPEFVPRLLTAPHVKIVMAGEVWVPDADDPTLYDYIEIQRLGTCKVARNRPTTLRFTTMVILPGGLLDIGTDTDRIVHRVRFIVRDVPIDPLKDPFGWGNGLLNFGRQVRAGVQKTQCADLFEGLHAGQRIINLSEAPMAWAAGDELVIPDTRFPTRDNPSRREPTITIESISGTALRLSQGLEFDHDPIALPELEIVSIGVGAEAVITTRGEANWLSWLANRQAMPGQASVTISGSTCSPSIDGTHAVTILGPNKFSIPKAVTGAGNSGAVNGPEVVYACVCNITRNISVESENPFGTPGHAVNVGSKATWEMRDYMHMFLGRTRAEPLDNTIQDVNGVIIHIGTHQIARYGDHDHHTGIGGSVSYRDGAVIIGRPPFKWGIVEHGTHYAEDRNCTVVGYAGAGFVTEDGYERGNTFRRCIGLYISGKLEQDNADANVTNNAPGIEGSAGWFRGVQDLVLDEFEGWCCRGAVLIFNQKQKPGMYPAARGEVPSIPFTEATARTAVPAIVRDTLAVCNYSIGWEEWTADDFLNVNLVSVRNRDMQYQHAASAANRPHLVNPLILGGDGRTVGIKAGMAYVERLVIEGGYVGDCEVGIADGGGFNRTTLSDVVFQCVQNIDYKDTDGIHTHTNVLHVPLKGHDPWYIQLGSGKVWDGVGDLSFDPAEHAPPCRGSQYTIFNHQGGGRIYQLFHNQSLGSLPAPYATPIGFFDVPGQQGHPVDRGCIPEKGLTVKEGWDKYGICYRGSFLDDSEKIALEGLKGGWGRLGTQIPLNPIPSATLYSPAPYFTAPVDHEANPSRGALLRVALVGDFTKADELLYYRINGGPTQTFEQRGGQMQDERRFFAEVGEGSHILETWRQVNPTSGPIAGSQRTWPFSVGTLPTLLTVPNVIGQTESAARAAIGNAHLIVDSTTSKHDLAAVGLVVSQSPTGGSQVPTGSSVSLALSLGPVMQVTVPNLVGQAQTQAQLLANGAGLALGALMTVHHLTVLAGLVIAQSPVAGTLVDLGSSIAITVSLGPDLPPPPPVETWTSATVQAEQSSLGRTRITIG